MEYDYYILSYNGIDTLYKINKGKIDDNVATLQVFYDGIWCKELKLRQLFMNKHATGWLNEEDAMNYESAIRMLNHKIIKAKSFAIEKHGDQKYGRFPYEIHLMNVVNVLLSNSILPNTEDKNNLWIAAWLHDVLEDTNTSNQEIIDNFGNYIFEIVWSLTDGDKGNRDEKKQIMYKKLILNQSAIIVKLADRIANLEFSIIDNNQNKIDKYVSENTELNKQLKEVITTDSGKLLLNYLNELVRTI